MLICRESVTSFLKGTNYGAAVGWLLGFGPSVSAGGYFDGCLYALVIFLGGIYFELGCVRALIKYLG